MTNTNMFFLKFYESDNVLWQWRYTEQQTDVSSQWTVGGVHGVVLVSG